MKTSNPTQPKITSSYLSFWLVGALVVGLHLTGVIERFDFAVQDEIVSSQQEILPSNIVIIEIDSQSLGEFNQWPWSRQVYANILEQLETASANSVFVDVDFSAVSNPADDLVLANAINSLSKKAKVRLPTFVQPLSIFDSALNLSQPLPDIAKSAELVSVNIQPAEDGLVRRLNAGFIVQETFFSSAWNAIAGKTGNGTYIDYRISPQSFQYLSIGQLLKQPLTPDQLRGKDVLIGSTAIELGDIVPVPVHQALPGIVLHGIAVETLLRGGLHKLSTSGAVLLLVLVGILASLLLKSLSWRQGLGAVAGLVIVSLVLSYISYRWLSLIVPGFSLALMPVFIYMGGIVKQLDLSILHNLWLSIRLLDREKLLASVFSASNDCILCVDEDGFVTSANERCKSIFACDANLLEGRYLGDLIPSARNGLTDLACNPFEATVIDSLFVEVPVEVCISQVVMSGKQSFTVAIKNLKERKEKEIALNYAASHDPLTGLLNRERFFELSDEEIDRNPLRSLIKVDVDYFNEINEIYGHEFGDKVLKTISSRILDTIYSRCVVGRIGKDDFAILIRSKPLDEVKLLAENLLSVLNQPFRIDDIPIELFCHIGISQTKESHFNVEELIRLSNVALQSAKGKGLEYDYCESTEQRIEPQHLNIVGAIRNILKNDDFDLAFQPKVSMASGETVGCEVLLRPPLDWSEDISISMLIEVAESTRLIADLTLRVVEKVLELERDWQVRNLPQQVSVNLSLGLLANDLFIADLIQRLDSGLGYFKLEFEITETSFTQNWQHSIKNIDRLMARGVTLAIDDFGTGYSSLAYLRDLRAKVLKIDKSFITNIHVRLENQSIVQSTIKMAHELGMNVVAEGIETAQERDFLLACRCDHGQGFLFSRPMYFAQFSTWVQARAGKNVLILPRKTDFSES